MIKVNGRDAEWHEGITIQDVLHSHNYTSPKIVIKVNDQVVRKPEWEAFVISDGDDVRVIHLIGGG